MDIIKKIVKHRTELVGIRLDGTYYEVDYTSDDAQTDEDLLIRAYQIDGYDIVASYEFTVADIRNFKSVKLYRLQEI